MRSKISAKLSKLYLFLFVVFLIVSNPVPGRSQYLNHVICNWEWKWVSGWETEYDTKLHQYRLVYRDRYKYVEDCDHHPKPDPNDPHGEIQKVWVDYDVNEDQKKGMRVHFNFNVFKYKGLPCSANVYFYKASGEPLKDLNGKYKTTGGDVAMYVNFTPGYENTPYNDVQLFMPYDELHLDTGKFDLKFVIELQCKGFGLIAHSDDHFFSYSNKYE